MADRITPDQRRNLMRRVRGRDTAPERRVRSLLHAWGYRFRLHRKDLPGRPDIVLPRHRKVVFVHGCFWHGHEHCRRAGRPTSNTEFWSPKLDRNRERDRRNLEDLARLGWRAFVVWECRLRDPAGLEAELRAFLAE